MAQLNYLGTKEIQQIIAVCHQNDTAPLWAYILAQQGLTVISEPSYKNAIGLWSTDMPDKVRNQSL
jgi:hypothetical protein